MVPAYVLSYSPGIGCFAIMETLFDFSSFCVTINVIFVADNYQTHEPFANRVVAAW